MILMGAKITEGSIKIEHQDKSLDGILDVV